VQCSVRTYVIIIPYSAKLHYSCSGISSHCILLSWSTQWFILTPISFPVTYLPFCNSKHNLFRRIKRNTSISSSSHFLMFRKTTKRSTSKHSIFPYYTVLTTTSKKQFSILHLLFFSFLLSFYVFHSLYFSKKVFHYLTIRICKKT
jgi:hypothetical protein